MTSMFGEPIARIEDDRLLRGDGAYLDDLGHDALACAFVRSPHAHARVGEIDVADALDIEGVAAIYTYEDLTDRLAEPLPLLIPHPALTHGRTGYPLAAGEVNYVGEPVVMVVAEDRYLAEDAAERIMVDYEPLPAVVGVDAARAADNLVHDDVPGNVAASLTQSNGDADAAIAAAPHTLELDLYVERSASTPLEGRGVLARWDTESRRSADLDIYADVDRRACRRSRQARAGAGRRRRDHTRRGRRVRGQDHAPVARGGAGAVGGETARQAGQIH